MSSRACFVHFCRNIMWTCFALTKAELCAECCARITVFHKLNDSESVAVKRYLMLVVCWWLNTWACLQRMVMTLAGRICSDCFTSLVVLFYFLFLISPLSFFLVLKATDPWRPVFIVGDILYHALRYTVRLWKANREFQPHSSYYSQLFCSGTIYWQWY